MHIFIEGDGITGGGVESRVYIGIGYDTDIVGFSDNKTAGL